MRSIIDESVYNFCNISLSNFGSASVIIKKLYAVIYAYEHGIKSSSEFFNVSKSTIYNWAKIIKSGDIESLGNSPKHQGGIKLQAQHKDLISSWLKKNPNLTIISVKEKLKQECGIDVGKSTVHRAMKKVGFSYITPRKKHYKQDQSEVLDFKKKST